MILRPYQQRARDAVIRVSGAGVRRILVVMPTGAGKTVFGSSFVRSATDKHRRSLWLTHRQELVEQSARAIGSCSIIRADDPRVDTDALATVASIPTLTARGLRPDADLVIIDEAHHVEAATWRALADHYSRAIIIGLTATPERADGSALGDVFERLIVGATYSELLAAGNLVDCDVIAAPKRQASLALSPAQAYDRHGNGRRAVIFTSTVAEALECAQVIPGARCVHGTMDDAQRAAALTARVVTNCMVLTEGWDSPETEVCILARGCTHASTYLQIAGRVLRPSPGKSRALLIDLAGCVHDHGHPLEDREYSLDGVAIRRVPGARSLWQCKGCGWISVTPPVDRACGQCQTPMPPPKRMSVQRNGRVIEVRWTCQSCGHQRSCMPLSCPMCGSETARGSRAASDDTDARVAYLHRMIELARSKGWSIYSARHRFAGKYGSQPSNDEWRAAQ